MLHSLQASWKLYLLTFYLWLSLPCKPSAFKVDTCCGEFGWMFLVYVVVFYSLKYHVQNSATSDSRYLNISQKNDGVAC